MDRHAMAGHPRVGAEPREAQRLPQELDAAMPLRRPRKSLSLGCRVALSLAQRRQPHEAAEISNPSLLSSKNKSVVGEFETALLSWRFRVFSG
jgi:hypothetical protein